MMDRDKVIKEAEETLSVLAPDEVNKRHIYLMVKVGWINDVIELLNEQKEKFDHLNNITLEYEKEVFRLQGLLKEQESKSIVDEVVQGVHEYYLIDDITRTEKIRAHSMLEALEEYKKKNRWDPVIVTKGEKLEERSEYYDE